MKNIFILSQDDTRYCFDRLSGCLRPRWESGPQGHPTRRPEPTQTLATAPKVAIHAHVYYLDLLPELLDGWAQVRKRHLLINTDCAQKARVIEALLRRRKERHYEIRLLPNRGRDLAPLLVGWRDRLAHFEVLVHCHTKKTPHAVDGFGERWRRSLVATTFPGRELCDWMALQLSAIDAGLLIPWPHRFVAHNVNWGKNFRQTRDLMRAMGLTIQRHTVLAFPAGSFFWARVDSLQPLFKLQLRWQDFAEEPIGGDGTLAHALERCIGLVPSFANRVSHALWMGSQCHDIHNEDLTDQACFVELPNETQSRSYAERLFDMGLDMAMRIPGPRDQSIPLNFNDCSGDFQFPS